MHMRFKNIWVDVFSFSDAINVINENNNLPNTISLDFDFINDDTNKNEYDLAKWIIEADMNGKYRIPSDFTYYIRSFSEQTKLISEKIAILFDNYFKKCNIDAHYMIPRAFS